MTDTELGPLAAALAKAQAGFPAVPRDREVTVQTKTGGSYKFKYAPLDTILSAVRGPLSTNGLAISQLLDGGDLVTMLLHESGATLAGRVAIPQDGNVQQLGSAITYLRRYALQAILGIASEEDDDGNASAGNRATPAARPSRAATPPAPVSVAPGLSPADVAELHARFADDGAKFTAGEIEEALDGIAATGGLTSAELFRMAEEQDIPKARLTIAAKSLFGDARWKVTDLGDAERYQLWEAVTMREGAPA